MRRNNGIMDIIPSLSIFLYFSHFISSTLLIVLLALRPCLQLPPPLIPPALSLSFTLLFSPEERCYSK